MSWDDWVDDRCIVTDIFHFLCACQSWILVFRVVLVGRQVFGFSSFHLGCLDWEVALLTAVIDAVVINANKLASISVSGQFHSLIANINNYRCSDVQYKQKWIRSKIFICVYFASPRCLETNMCITANLSKESQIQKKTKSKEVGFSQWLVSS